LNIGDLELMFIPAYPAAMTEDDKATYIISIGEVIALDAVVIASSGNITVSHCFPPTSNSD